MSTSLKDRITEDMKSAMRAKQSERLGAIRLLLAAIKQKEVDERVTVDDAAVLGIIEKMIKQRNDSIEQFEKAARTDLAEKEKDELQLLKGLSAAADVGGRVVSRDRCSDCRVWRDRSAGDGKGDGAAKAAHCRACRHGQGVGASQAAAGLIFSRSAQGPKARIIASAVRTLSQKMIPAKLHPGPARARRHR